MMGAPGPGHLSAASQATLRPGTRNSFWEAPWTRTPSRSARTASMRELETPAAGEPTRTPRGKSSLGTLQFFLELVGPGGSSPQLTRAKPSPGAQAAQRRLTNPPSDRSKSDLNHESESESRLPIAVVTGDKVAGSGRGAAGRPGAGLMNRRDATELDSEPPLVRPGKASGPAVGAPAAVYHTAIRVRAA